MTELAATFEEHRRHLRQVAYRMLGAASEADDAVQEAWLRFASAEASAIQNVRGWLTTVVARICLDLLRTRSSRREDALAEAPEPAAAPRATVDRELADAIGLAVLVVLDQLEPAERIAFVLHDVVAMPFEEIAPIVGRTPAAARQLASRARRRLQGAPPPEAELAAQRRVVDAFIAAMRAGDVDALVAVLGGNQEWARGAIAYHRAAEHMRPVLVDGYMGLAFAPGGVIGRVLIFTFDGATIREAEIVVDPDALGTLAVTELA